MLADGTGGPQDDAGARARMILRCRLLEQRALERMGAFASEGRGGPKDRDVAKAYYKRAADLGNEQAKVALKKLDCPVAIKDKRGNFVTDLCF